MDNSPKSRRRLPFPWVVGFALWGISGTITVSLFLALADDNLSKMILAGFWAGSLEASKILTLDFPRFCRQF
jgi:hypothetical protein